MRGRSLQAGGHRLDPGHVHHIRMLPGPIFILFVSFLGTLHSCFQTRISKSRRNHQEFLGQRHQPQRPQGMPLYGVGLFISVDTASVNVLRSCSFKKHTVGEPPTGNC